MSQNKENHAVSVATRVPRTVHKKILMRIAETGALNLADYLRSLIRDDLKNGAKPNAEA
jgi:hypothetical protein